MLKVRFPSYKSFLLSRYCHNVQKATLLKFKEILPRTTADTRRRYEACFILDIVCYANIKPTLFQRVCWDVFLSALYPRTFYAIPANTRHSNNVGFMLVQMEQSALVERRVLLGYLQTYPANCCKATWLSWAICIMSLMSHMSHVSHCLSQLLY